MNARSGILTGLVLLLFVPTSAGATAWGLGLNAGISSLRTGDNNEKVTTFAWPSTNPAPGIRVSITGSDARQELFLDTGLAIVTVDEHNSSKVTAGDFIVKSNYQYNLGGSRRWAPHVFAGAGLDLTWARREDVGTDANGNPATSTSKESSNSLVYGGGVGVAHNMGDGHVRCRLDLRYDRLRTFKLNLFSAQVGFDLWNGRR